MAKAERCTMVGLTFQLWPQIYMADTIQNGLAPFQQNGHDAQVPGHEVSNGLQQNNLLMEEVLKGEEHNAPTAKMDSPEAGTKQATVSETTTVEAQPKSVNKEKKKAARYEETGNATNVQNLRLVTQRIKGFGPSYAQGSPLYTIANMEAVYNTAATSLQEVTAVKQAYDNAIDQQNQAFGDVKDLSTRTKNFFTWCGVSDKAIERMEYLNHQIQGTRVIPIKDGDSDDHISASHQSRTQQIQHVDALVEFLESFPAEYLSPDVISVDAWKAKRDAMDSTFLQENITSSNLKAARIQRNVDIYKTTTGVVEIGLGAKRVVLAIYGYNSPQYAAVKGIKFTRIKGWENL